VERAAAWLADAVKADRRAELEVGRTLLADTVHWFEQELERRLDALTHYEPGFCRWPTKWPAARRNLQYL
jgi:hypothetical protein